jgi:hypothetical protein
VRGHDSGLLQLPVAVLRIGLLLLRLLQQHTRLLRHERVTEGLRTTTEYIGKSFGRKDKPPGRLAVLPPIALGVFTICEVSFRCVGACD